MSAKLTSQTDSKAEFIISLTEAELQPHLQHAYEELRPRVKAAGFRPGKAPDVIVERELGSSAVQSEALEHAVMQSYAEAVTAESLPVIAPPEVNVTKFVPYTELEYKATVELMPKVNVPDYQHLKARPKPETVADDAIDQVIDDLGKRLATRLEVKRAAAKGDELTIDFDGKKAGEVVKGASAKDYHLTLGSGSFIPGFEDQLVGLKVGQSKTFTVTFPKDYHEKTLADQPVEFEVTINKVEEPVLPEVNQAFVEQVSPFKSVEELRDNVRQQLQAEKDEQVARAFENELLGELVTKTKFTPPQRLIDQQLGRLKEELAQNLASSGLDLDKYLQLRNQTTEQLEAELKPEASKRVTLAVVLTEIARAEKITVSEDDINEELGRLQQQYQDPQFQAELSSPSAREEIYNHMMASRVIARLVEYTKNQ